MPTISGPSLNSGAACNDVSFRRPNLEKESKPNKGIDPAAFAGQVFKQKFWMQGKFHRRLLTQTIPSTRMGDGSPNHAIAP